MSHIGRGCRPTNHNQSVKGLRVKSSVKAGGEKNRHNQTVARRAR